MQSNAFLQEDYFLGIELGSTRIKAVLIDKQHTPIAAGAHNWENKLENGLWTYGESAIWQGLQSCYQSLSDDVFSKFGQRLTTVGGIGVSAMMHGYLVFDKQGKLLVPFRTWRNTNTEAASAKLTESLGFSIPLRWSIAHLYQAALDNEPHVSEIAYMTTLAGYIHWKLTGERVLGIGDASGMFPIDCKTSCYDEYRIAQSEQLLKFENIELKLANILPKILVAGQPAGTLSKQGAALLDTSGKLLQGIPFCPPEGDAGTGMVATNAVKPLTGNVSAGTSVFAMTVLDKALTHTHSEIDMVTTPTGKPVAMIHCNNCTSDINAWAMLFSQFSMAAGSAIPLDAIYTSLFEQALQGDKESGDLLHFNYFSGEPITGLHSGRPMLVRMPDSQFSFANFARSLLFSALATLRIGMDILKHEGVQMQSFSGHGGLGQLGSAFGYVLAG